MDDLEDDISELSSISSYPSSPGSISQNLLGETSDISYIGQEDDESQILSSRSASLAPTPTPQPKRKLTFLNILDCSGDPGFAWVGSGWVCHRLGGVWVRFLILRPGSTHCEACLEEVYRHRTVPAVHGCRLSFLSEGNLMTSFLRTFVTSCTQQAS